MNTELINIGLAFLEGFALIITPCILPILPIILSGSLTSGKSRPFGIILGFVATFALFTFFSKKLVELSGIDLNLVRNLSFVLLISFGLIMISDYLSAIFEKMTNRLTNIGQTVTSSPNSHSGFLSGILFGSFIGLVWTPCAGPLLAAVIVQTVLQKTNLASFFTVLAFGIGAGVPMLMIAIFGRGIMNKFAFLRNKASFIRRILGSLIIISVILMFYGNSLALSFTKPATTESNNGFKTTLANPYPAPNLEGITQWINSNPIHLNELKGKVVLIDFWAYSCINCIRTFPYLIDWYQKYKDKGLVIIGVHSPEFDFERDFNNVKQAVQKYNIPYPIALDNDFMTWQNYRNRYWPAHYLIDKNNQVVYTHFGEGEYDTTENNIRILLGIETSISKDSTPAPGSLFQSPETYLGYERADNFASPETVEKNSEKSYTFPKFLAKNAWGLKGRWKISSEKIMNTEANAAIKMHYSAGKVYAVMGTKNQKSIMVKIMQNGEELIDDAGKDVKNSLIEVKNHTLYSVIEAKTPSSGILELIPLEPGLEIYTFTFGK